MCYVSYFPHIVLLMFYSCNEVFRCFSHVSPRLPFHRGRQLPSWLRFACYYGTLGSWRFRFNFFLFFAQNYKINFCLVYILYKEFFHDYRKLIFAFTEVEICATFKFVDFSSNFPGKLCLTTCIIGDLFSAKRIHVCHVARYSRLLGPPRYQPDGSSLRELAGTFLSVELSFFLFKENAFRGGGVFCN